MADDRLMLEAERLAVEPLLHVPPARISTVIRSTVIRRRDSDPPPSSHRRLLGWLRSDVGCAHCARRAAQGNAATLGLARTSCQFLAATWVVLTLSDP
jgi:hypothetical protein